MVVGVEKRLVAPTHEDHEVRQVRTRAHDLLCRESLHPAACIAQGTLILIVKEALQILILNDLGLGSSLVREDILYNARDGRDG